MHEENPYSSSVLQAEPPARRSSNQELNEELNGTRPWVLFIAILGFIIGGLMLAGSLLVGIATGIGGFMEGEGAFAAGMGFGIVLVYGLLAFLYLIPSYFLYKYGAAIGRIQENGMEAVVEALASQRKFWKTLGVMIVSVIILYFVLIAFALVFGAFGAFATI